MELRKWHTDTIFASQNSPALPPNANANPDSYPATHWKMKSLPDWKLPRMRMAGSALGSNWQTSKTEKVNVTLPSAVIRKIDHYVSVHKLKSRFAFLANAAVEKITRAER